MFLIAAFGTLVAIYLWQPSKPTWLQIVRFFSELKDSREALEKLGQSPPASAKVEDLVRSGFISEKSARGFAGATVTFTSLPREAALSQPQTPSILLQMRDGRKVALTADGGIHQFVK